MSDTTSATQNTNADQAAALREAADFIAAHPDLPPAYVAHFGKGRAHMNYYLHINGTHDLEEQKADAAAIVRAAGGDWKKRPYNESEFRYTTQRGLLDFDVQVKRDAVCERIVVGTEEVTIPASEAVEALPERVEVREVVEWRCLPLLADEAVAS